jgi:predicted DNA-binding protein with PD1-like motif
MQIQYKTASAAETAVARLPRGTDLMEGIAEVCRRAGFNCAVVNCCVGSLASAALMYLIPADNPMGSAYCEPLQLEGPLELLATQGMAGPEPNGDLFVHLHGAVCAPDGRVHGGHLIAGRCPVLYTAEIMLSRPQGVALRRTHDADIGMPVLMPFDPD